jgi:hypothetical protein
VREKALSRDKQLKIGFMFLRVNGVCCLGLSRHMAKI